MSFKYLHFCISFVLTVVHRHFTKAEENNKLHSYLLWLHIILLHTHTIVTKPLEIDRNTVKVPYFLQIDLNCTTGPYFSQFLCHLFLI